MTPNTPMTELSKKVDEMLAGLEGVTPGPWEADKWGDGSSGDDWIICAPAIEAVLAPTVRFADDAAHIARCDPDTMRQILTLAKQALRQPDTRIEGGGEPVAWVTADILAAMKRGDRAVPGWKRSEEFCIPLYATPPLNKSPTPEHVEGDVLSVGEMERLREAYARWYAEFSKAFITQVSEGGEVGQPSTDRYIKVAFKTLDDLHDAYMAMAALADPAIKETIDARLSQPNGRG